MSALGGLVNSCSTFDELQMLVRFYVAYYK